MFSLKNNPINLAIRNFLESSRFAKGRQLKRINETRKLISEDNANRRISRGARLDALRDARAQADLNIEQENLRRLSLGKPELTEK